jgi:hypothetical protein
MKARTTRKNRRPKLNANETFVKDPKASGLRVKTNLRGGSLYFKYD